MAVAPSLPQLLHRIRGPKDGTGRHQASLLNMGHEGESDTLALIIIRVEHRFERAAGEYGFEFSRPD
jgi:hypothetical protein